MATVRPFPPAKLPRHRTGGNIRGYRHFKRHELVADHRLEHIAILLLAEVDAGFYPLQQPLLVVDSLHLVSVPPPRGVKLEARQFVGRCKLPDGSSFPQKGDVGRQALGVGMTPLDAGTVYRRGICERRRRHEVPRGEGARSKYPRQATNARAGRPIQDRHAGYDLGRCFPGSPQDCFKMGRIPDIVMPEIGNPVRSSIFVGEVVRRPLPAMVLVEIVPAQAGVIELCDDRRRVVRAAVSDDQDFKILHRLQQHRTDRAAERAAPIVGRDRYRNGGL